MGICSFFFFLMFLRKWWSFQVGLLPTRTIRPIVAEGFYHSFPICIEESGSGESKVESIANRAKQITSGPQNSTHSSKLETCFQISTQGIDGGAYPRPLWSLGHGDIIELWSCTAAVNTVSSGGFHWPGGLRAELSFAWLLQGGIHAVLSVPLPWAVPGAHLLSAGPGRSRTRGGEAVLAVRLAAVTWAHLLQLLPLTFPAYIRRCAALFAPPLLVLTGAS